MAKQESILQVAGRQIKLTNLDKVLYPKVGFTKGQVVDYMVRIAPVLLPHLAGRPLTLKRYPEGVEGMFFYEKNCPKHRPDWVNTAKVWSEGNNRYMYYCVVDELPTLVWLANLADLELHTSLAVVPEIHKPTVIAFDLDPGPPANIVQCCQVGLWIRDIFAQLGLQAFPKTSGSKGLQVYVPLNTSVNFDQTKTFANAVARLLEERYPDQVVSDMKKALRTNRVFVDWSQNDDHKTTICVYSLRAKDQPTVSTPVTWSEVETCLKKSDPQVLGFISDQVLQRVEEMGDLFEPVLKLKQKLPPIESLQEFAEGATTEVVDAKPIKPRNISSVERPRKSPRRRTARKA
ncbi:MAG TPA: non-homologous end-joining DNA ligase [Candidatus Angelobacter sp.]|jgi:bifunctional non-homologous end joining protein LigD|nr:non-homologous end-joining DNA ligase [Candidatus Angelobacter sp.]